MRAAPRVVCSIAALLCGTFLSCKPEVPPPPDAGDEMFVRRAVELMWGRTPEGVAEIRILHGMLGQADRPSLIRAMARSPEYVDHWSEVVRDLLRINRTGDRGNAACYGVGRAPVVDASIARWVRDHAPEEPGIEPSFSMQDLLRSALMLDDLAPVFQANLFAQLAKDIPLQGVDSALIVEENLYRTFEETYLNREMACLGCHNSEGAVTDSGDPALDRHHPPAGRTDRAIFGDPHGRDPKDLYTLFRKHGVLSGYDIFDQIYGFVATGCFPTMVPGCDHCACEEAVCAIDPSCCTDRWEQGCVDLCQQAGLGCEPGVPDGWHGCSSLYGYPGCNGCECEFRVCSADPSCCTDSWSETCAIQCRLIDSTCESFDWSDYTYGGHRVWGLHESCGTYLLPEDAWPDPVGIPTFLIGDLGADATAYDLERPLRTGFAKLRSGYRLGEVDDEEGDAALAALVTLRLSDAVWRHAMGSSLTIANHFPRNAAQRDILERLAAASAAGGLSLVELLVALTSEPAFNPVAPADASDGAYTFAPAFNPWVVEDEVLEQRNNSVGDIVHRRDARVLVRSANHALALPHWPSFPADTDIGDEGKVQEQLGFFLKDSIHGFTGNDFQGLAAWEGAFGACSAEPEHHDGCWPRSGPGCLGCRCEEDVCRAWPSCCDVRWDQRCTRFCSLTGLGCAAGPAAPPPSIPWLPRFVEEARARDAAGGGLVLRDLVRALKDRILADPVLDDPDEIAAIEALAGISLDTPLASLEDPEDPLRWVCAAFLSTPQFQLSGVASESTLGQEPPIVLPDAEEQAICERIAATQPEGALRCDAGTPTFRP